LDIWSRAIVGWAVKDSENKENAAVLIEDTIKNNNARGVCIHSDNGKPMRNGTIDALYEKLGIIQSHSRPVDWYNNEHTHSGIKYVTPNQRHTDADVAILEVRKRTYKEAKNKNPQRDG
jgi:putative transposase